MLFKSDQLGNCSMTPFEFGQFVKSALEPLSQRPRADILAEQAKLFPHMVEMARANNQNQLQAIPAFENSVLKLTGTAPTNWETHDALSAPNTGFAKVRPLSLRK